MSTQQRSPIQERAAEAKAMLRALWPEEVVFPEPSTDPHRIPIDSSACARAVNPDRPRMMVSTVMGWRLFVQELPEAEA